MKYGQIIFLQDEAADEALRILKECGTEACIKHLARWDYGDDGLVLRNESSAGKGDIMLQHDNYVLSYNLSLGYIGLERIIH